MKALVILLALALSGCSAVSPFDESSAQLYLEQHLDAAWKDRGLTTDRPVGGSPRFVLPDGWDGVMAGCMVSSGFTRYTYSRETGVTNGERSRNESGAEGLAWYHCSQRFPTSDVELARPDAAELDVLETYYTSWLEPCLVLNGAGEVRKPADFDGAWNPYLTLATVPSTHLTDLLLDKCPAYPPLENPAERAS